MALLTLRKSGVYLPCLGRTPSDHRRGGKEMRKPLLGRECNQRLCSVLGRAHSPVELLKKTKTAKPTVR
jgi:hypothetical protein